MSGKYEDAFIIISVTIPVNCQKLIDGLMPQIKDMERTLYGTYHRKIRRTKSLCFCIIMFYAMRTLDLWFHFVTRDLCVITFATRKNKTDVII